MDVGQAQRPGVEGIPAPGDVMSVEVPDEGGLVVQGAHTAVGHPGSQRPRRTRRTAGWATWRRAPRRTSDLWVMSKPASIQEGKPRQSGRASAMLTVSWRLTASRVALPVHGVSATRATTPELQSG